MRGGWGPSDGEMGCFGFVVGVLVAVPAFTWWGAAWWGALLIVAISTLLAVMTP